MKKELVIEKIHRAYNILMSRDNYLFSVEANERSITHKLAEYLQIEFSEWNVDCEYNRNGLDIKRLDSFRKTISSDDINAITVYPDIIVHHRGTMDNLVVIEGKKKNYTAQDFDIQKLKAYKIDLGYKFAFKVTFPVGETIANDFNISTYVEEK